MNQTFDSFQTKQLPFPPAFVFGSYNLFFNRWTTGLILTLLVSDQKEGVWVWIALNARFNAFGVFLGPTSLFMDHHTQQNAHTNAFLGLTALFIPLKIILLQYFQQINGIQIDME